MNIEVNNLIKSYKNGDSTFVALKGVSFTIPSGQSVAIVGKSGSGKSTLMHVLAGLDTPTSGHVLFDEKDFSKFSPDEKNTFRSNKIGFIFQQFFLQPNLTVLENVILPLKIQGVSAKERTRLGLEALDKVGLKDKSKNLAVNLSGGQKQRACIARALVGEPEVIFADEPTGNLDSENGKIVEDLIFQFNKEFGITTIIVTHDEDLAARCHQQITIKDGEIITNKKA